MGCRHDGPGTVREECPPGAAGAKQHSSRLGLYSVPLPSPTLGVRRCLAAWPPRHSTRDRWISPRGAAHGVRTRPGPAPPRAVWSELYSYLAGQPSAPTSQHTARSERSRTPHATPTGAMGPPPHTGSMGDHHVAPCTVCAPTRAGCRQDQWGLNSSKISCGA